jgi:hypothetical protein
LDGSLRVLGWQDGNGLRAMIIPSRVKSATEDWELEIERDGRKA